MNKIWNEVITQRWGDSRPRYHLRTWRHYWGRCFASAISGRARGGSDPSDEWAPALQSSCGSHAPSEKKKGTRISEESRRNFMTKMHGNTGINKQLFSLNNFGWIMWNEDFWAGKWCEISLEICFHRLDNWTRINPPSAAAPEIRARQLEWYFYSL